MNLLIRLAETMLTASPPARLDELKPHAKIFLEIREPEFISQELGQQRTNSGGQAKKMLKMQVDPDDSLKIKGKRK